MDVDKNREKYYDNNIKDIFNSHDTRTPITQMDDKSPAPGSKFEKYYNSWTNKLDIPIEVLYPCN